MKLWWVFRRYSHAIDLYMALRSNNKAAANFARQCIAECDRQIDILAVNHV